MTDPNVEMVRAKLLERSKVGIKKYGCTTANAGLTRLQWLQHAQEEALDLAVYLEQLIEEEIAPDRIPDGFHPEGLRDQTGIENKAWKE